MFWFHEWPDLSKSIWSMFGSDGKSGSLDGISRLSSVVVFGLFGEGLSSVAVCDLFGERFSSIVVLVSVQSPRISNCFLFGRLGYRVSFPERWNYGTQEAVDLSLNAHQLMRRLAFLFFFWSIGFSYLSFFFV